MSVDTEYPKVVEAAKETGVELIHFNTGRRVIDIYTNSSSFRPNRVSEAFIQGLPQSLEGKTVYDIGSGGGVIAIEEAFSGADVVYAVEPARANFELLLRNIELNERAHPEIRGRIIPNRGCYFDPLKGVEKADVITADVSGIPDIFGRAMGWYPEGIDTGGSNGYEISCELLKRAPKHLKQSGLILFPTADDLLDEEKILGVARTNFGRVENALCTPEQLAQWKEQNAGNGKAWRTPDYVWFALTGNDIERVKNRYGGTMPESIDLQNVKGRYFWRGRIHRASEPKE